MNNKIKKPVLFLLCLSATLATLSACGKKKNVTTAKTNTTSQITTKTNTTTKKPTTTSKKDVTTGPKVYFIADGEIIKEVSYNSDTVAVKEPTIPEKSGYAASWMPYELNGKDIYVTAIYTKLNTKYKIEYYLENLLDDEYTIVSEDTQEYDSTVNETIKPFIKSYEGFSCTNSDAGMTLVQDKTQNVLKIYYDRDRFNVKIDYDGVKENKDINVKYGTVLNEANPEKAGYDFIKWTDKYNEEYDMTQEVTSALELKANFTPRTNIKYTVKYYKENLDDIYEEDTASRQNLTGTVDTLAEVTLNENKYTGYVIDTDKTVSSGNINGDESLVLEVYYKLKRFNVTYKYADGVTEDYVTIVKYNQKAENISVSREGYTFNGWIINNTYYDFNSSITSDITLFASYNAQSGKAYKINYYIPDLNTGEYVLDDYTIDSGYTGDEIIADTKLSFYYGYEVNEEKSNTKGNILADGSLVLNVYYNRKTYTFNFFDGNEVFSVKNALFEETFDMTQVIEKVGYEGYRFIIYKASNQQDISHVVTYNTLDQLANAFDTLYDNYGTAEYNIYVDYSERTDTKYTVKLFYENILDDDYTLAETITLYGKTNSQIEPEDIDHFTFYTARGESEDDQLTIKPDGSTVIRAYYKRDTYDVTLRTNTTEQEDKEYLKVKYGAQLNEPALTKLGYSLAGYKDHHGKTFNFSDGISEDLTIDANWSADYNQFSVKIYYQKTEYDDEFDFDLIRTDLITNLKTNESFTVGDYLEELDGLYYWDFRYNSSVVAPDGSTCLEIYYLRNTFNIYFDTNGANHGISALYDVRYEHVIDTQEIEKDGYHLVHWIDTNHDDEVYSFGTPVTRNMQLKAIWEANTNTAYTVCINKENFDDSYDEFEQTYYGTTDTEIDLDQFVEEFTGFTFESKNANSVVTREDETTYVNLNGDGSTYINIYYLRNRFEVKFTCNNADFNISDKTMKYDDILEDPNLTKAGYTLVKWVDHNNDDAEYTFGNAITSNLDLEAIWEVNTDTKYIVKYFLPALDGQFVEQVEEHYGTTDTELNYEDFKKEFNGFHYTTYEQNHEYIAGDKSTYIYLYYQRNNYQVRIYTDNQTYYDLNTNDFKYENEITISAYLYGNLGYLFDGIYADENYENNLTHDTEYTFTITGDIDFYIRSKEIDDLADFTFNSDDKDIIITGLKENVVITNLVIPSVATYIGSDAFYRNYDIKTVYISKNIKAIETSAFMYCKLDLVEFDPDCNIEYIETQAFAEANVGEFIFCDNIKEFRDSSFYNLTISSFTLPKNIEIIGSNALEASWNNHYSKNTFVVDTLIIPKSVKKIGDSAFNYAQIKNLIFEDGIEIEKMGSMPFAYCNIKNITLPNNIDAIGDNTFNYSMDNSILFIPKNIKSIGENTFYNANISKIVFEEGSLLEEIKDNAFGYNSNLIGLLILPDNLKTIGKSAFYNCQIDSIKLNSELCSIDDEAFNCCYQLKTIYNNSSLILEAGSTDHGYVAYYVSDSANIHNNSYSQNIIIDGNYVYYVEITDGVETDRILLSYTGDEKVINTINPRTKKIADNVFRGKNMYDVIIPDQVVEIGNNAFYGCKYLSRITIGPNVEIIGQQAFSSCDRLVEIYNKSEHITLTIGDTDNGWLAYNAVNIYEGSSYTPNVSLDGEYIVFSYEDEYYLIGKYEDTSIREITIPSYITIIYKKALYDMQTVNKVDLSSSNVKIIMDYALYNMSYVTYLALPQTLEEICEGALSNVGISTEGITYFNIEDCTNLKTIRSYALSEFNYINDLVLPESVETLEEAAFNRSRIKSITLGSKIKQLLAFRYCYNLENIYYSSENNVEEIGSEAFIGCTSLTYFEVGSHVIHIGADAFKNCYKLYEIYNKSELDIEKYDINHGGIGYYAYAVYTDERPESFYNDDNFVYYNDGTDLVLVNYIGESDTVVIPNNVTIIGHAAFYNRNGLTISFAENSSIKKIEEYAFYECYGDYLDLRDMPNLEEIGYKAFVSTNFHTLYISKKITSLGIDAFVNTTIEIIIFDKETPLTSITEGLFNGAHYNALLIPSQITSIGAYNNPNSNYSVNYIFYYGTAEQFANLVIDDLDNNNLINFFENVTYLYSETEVDGNYWRYNEEGYPISCGAYAAGQTLKRIVELMKYYLEEAHNNSESEYITHDSTGIYEYGYGLRIETEGLYNFLSDEESSELSLFDNFGGYDLALYYDGENYEAGMESYTTINGFYVDINSTNTDFFIRREY